MNESTQPDQRISHASHLLVPVRKPLCALPGSTGNIYSGICAGASKLEDELIQRRWILWPNPGVSVLGCLLREIVSLAPVGRHLEPCKIASPSAQC